MSILRGIGNGLGGIVFVTCLGFLIILLSFSDFIQYDSIKPAVAGLIAPQITNGLDQTQLTFLHQMLLQNCTGNEKITIPLKSEAISAPLEVNCSEIKNSNAGDLGNIIANATFDQMYYKKYDCSFLACITLAGKDPLFIITQKMSDVVNKAIFYLGIGTVAGILLILICAETWADKLKTIGISSIFIGLTYFVLLFTKNLILKNIAGSEVTATVIEPFIVSLSSRLLLTLVVGIVLTIIGVIVWFVSKKK